MNFCSILIGKSTRAVNAQNLVSDLIAISGLAMKQRTQSLGLKPG